MGKEVVLPETVTITLEEYVSLRAFKAMYEQRLQGEELERREAREADAKNMVAASAMIDAILKNIMSAIQAYRRGPYGGSP